MRIAALHHFVNTDHIYLPVIILNKLFDERPKEKLHQLFIDTIAFRFVLGMQQRFQCSISEETDDIERTHLPSLQSRHKQCLQTMPAEYLKTQFRTGETAHAKTAL
jgi:hypothetical protein